ncbi:MAG: hypothetical protein HKN62_09025 [Phycisphaerales bacterium]|nr:hypothetical protein [Phycisphaerales bacterium]
MLVGEVVEETRKVVKFRCQVNGIWTTITLQRGQVSLLEHEEGDQSDAAAAGTTTTEPARPAAPTPKPKPRNAPHIAVIPLHGQVGGLVDGELRGTFDAGVIEHCFEQALAAGATVAVLDVHSPGGLVTEMEAISETIIAWHDRMRIVAFPDEAFSAAAVISMCCREIVIRPRGLIGAAVIIKRGPGGTSALTAKMASPHYARQRQYMEASGHAYEILQAMTIQTAELWWSPDTGCRELPPDTARDGWERLDDRTTVLTLTAEEARRIGLAIGEADGIESLADILALDADLPVIRYDEPIELYNRRLDKRLSQLRRSFENYFEGLAGIVEGLNAFAAAAQAGDRRMGEQAKATTRRAWQKSLAAARKIGRTDRSLLARRVEVPDRIIDRIEDDRKMIGRIRQLVETETIDGFNDAADRINAVLQAWRELLG